MAPEEQSRRMSRTSTVVPGQSSLSPLPGVNRAGLTQDNCHRYSWSVPAPSLLSDIRSIWANPDGELTNTNGIASKELPTSITSNPLVGGLSASYKSDFTTDGPSPSMLQPSQSPHLGSTRGRCFSALSIFIRETIQQLGGLSWQHWSPTLRL